jgi:hypothetical protein
MNSIFKDNGFTNHSTVPTTNSILDIPFIHITFKEKEVYSINSYKHSEDSINRNTGGDTIDEGLTEKHFSTRFIIVCSASILYGNMGQSRMGLELCNMLTQEEINSL